jgi:hypothetical protein
VGLIGKPSVERQPGERCAAAQPIAREVEAA